MKKTLFILTLIFCFTLNLSAQIAESENLLFVYSLHGQTRKYSTTFSLHNDTLRVKWGIERNTKWQSGEYITLPEALKSGKSLNFLQPIDKQTVILPKDETFSVISRNAYRELKEKGTFVYGNTTFSIYNKTSHQEIVNCNLPLLHVIDKEEGCEMWILDDPSLPVIWKMKNNPVEINWEVKFDGDNIFNIKHQIALMPEKSASTYYAYPAYSWQHTPAPTGFKPFYISHYGRHGSRWITDEKRYTDVIDVFNKLNLTELGKDVKSRLEIIFKDAKGNAGLLSPVGQKQHHELARRMFINFPEVFAGNREISAYSTIVPRCIKSMECFTDELTSLNKELRIKKDSDKKNMAYMAFDTPQMKQWNDKDAAWRKNFTKFEKENTHSQRLMKSLFTESVDKIDADAIMMGLYWIASDMQDTTTDISFYDIFTSDELFNIWRAINYRMYLCNGTAPINNDIPAASASSLLKDIVDKANIAIKSNNDCATLRFGHDTNLLRLISLIGIKEYSGKETDAEKYHEVWQDFNITPMAANLQIIFYKSDKDEVLVKFMVNEKEVHLNTSTDSWPYYKWNEVCSYFSNKI